MLLDTTKKSGSIFFTPCLSLFLFLKMHVRLKDIDQKFLRPVTVRTADTIKPYYSYKISLYCIYMVSNLDLEYNFTNSLL